MSLPEVGDPPEPGDRVREEGGSPALVRWTERIDEHAPAVGDRVGWWVSVYARFARHRGSVLAGGLAFFALLSLVPAVLTLGAVVAVFFDPAEFAASAEDALAPNPELLKALTPFLNQIASLSPVQPGSLGVAGVVGFAISLYAASRFVYVGRQVLDIAFELEPRHPSILGRAVAIVITLLTQVVIIVAVLVLTFLPRLLDALRVGDELSQNLRLVRIPVAVVVVYLMLTAAMRFGIAATRSVRWINIGAALGTVLIVLGTVGLGWYLGVSATYSQIVAVLGGVVALEIWLYVVGLAIVGAAEIEGMRLGFRRRDLVPITPATDAEGPA